MNKKSETQAVSRDFTAQEWERIIEQSVQAGTNLTPFVCRENFDCLYMIARCIRTAKKFRITPEEYWSGNQADYTSLLTMLEAGFPARKLLLSIAREKQPGEIEEIAQRFCQYSGAMLELDSRVHGYVVMRPSEYMKSLFPSMAEKLLVYTVDVFENPLSDVDSPVLVVEQSERGTIAQKLRKHVQTF